MAKRTNWKARALAAEKVLWDMEDQGLLQSLYDLDSSREEDEDYIAGPVVRAARAILKAVRSTR